MPSAPSSTYVANLFYAVLLRFASNDEDATWASLIDSGALTPQQATASIEDSPEAMNFVDPIVRLYLGFFGRAPDQAGLQGWVDALRDGTLTLQQIADDFAGSAEFQGIFGTSPSPTAFVTALYANVLGRAPDPAGLSAWVNAIAGGTLSFGQVALGFTQSPEFIADSSGAIDNWFTIANAREQAGPTPIYIGGTIPGAVPVSGHSFDLTFGAQTIAGSGQGGDTINAPVLNYAFAGTIGESPTLSGTSSIVIGGTNNVLNATLASQTPIAPTIQGVQTWNLTNIQSPGGTATVNAGNVSGVTTINDVYSTAGIVVGTTGKSLQSMVKAVSLDNVIGGAGLSVDIAAAKLSGGDDTLNVNLVGPTGQQFLTGPGGTVLFGPPPPTTLAIGPDSGSNGYETFAITASGNNDLILSQNPTGATNGSTYSTTTITVAGSGNLTLLTDVDTNWNDLRSIDASASTGDIVISGADLGVGTTGILTADTNIQTLKGGAGDDTFDLSSLLTAASVNAVTTLNGGNGTNTLILNSIAAEGASPLTTAIDFQDIVDVNPGSGGGIINWSDLGLAATTLVYGGSVQVHSLTIDNAPNGFTLREGSLGNGADGVTINGPSGAADGVTISLGTGAATDGGDNSGMLTVNGFETVTIATQGGVNQFGVDTVAGLDATATSGGPEALVISGGQPLAFDGSVILSGTNATITVTDLDPVTFAGSVTATTIDAQFSGGIKMTTEDLAVSGTTGDTITGSLGAANQIVGSAGNDVIVGGPAGDAIVTGGGADAITLGKSNSIDVPGGDSHDVIELGVASPAGTSLGGAIVMATATDTAEPGFWGLAPSATPAPQGGLAADTGTSLDQSVVTMFQAGPASTTDTLAFSVQEWGASGANLGLVTSDLSTQVAGANPFGRDMVPGVVHIGGTVAAGATLIELTDASFASADAMVAALHGGSYGFSFAGALASASDFAHILVAYNDPSGNVHIADLDATGAASASSTALTLRASDMVELVGVPVQSLQPNNVVFIS